VSRALAPAARAAGALVIDNSSAFRLDPECPLVIPELNGETLAGHAGIVANPNCSTILLCMAVAPLQRAAGIRRLVACSYQAVSGAGARAIEEMRRQEEAERAGQVPECAVFPAVIAHNVIPWVQAIGEDGHSTEETKVRDETRRILGLPDLPVGTTCVRVPVWRAHAEAVHVALERPLAPVQALALYEEAEGIRVRRDDIPTPREVSGTDEVHVGRVRTDRAFTPGLALWCVMDQLRKGAALNAVQIAERALRN
jgi:aspartate-semialdehyde dehydrogenase